MIELDKIKLPSNGLLKVPKEITIRGLNVGELATIYASMSDASIDTVLKGIIQVSFDTNLLTDEDKSFILHRARQLTFGTDIVVGTRCPFCGEIESAHSVSYDDFKVDYLTPEIVNEELELSNGDKVTRNFPTEFDKEQVKKLIMNFSLTSPGDKFTLSQVLLLDKVNGSKLSALDKLNYIRNMTPMDFSKLVQFNIYKYGINTTYTVECKGCGQTYTGGIGLSADLFR